MKSKNRLRIFLFPLFCILILTAGCISSSSFQKCHGPSEFYGRGGTCHTIDGIDIWENGEPNRKYKLLGLMDTNVVSSTPALIFFGDSWSDSALIKEAKKQGCDAIIFIDSGFEGNYRYGAMSQRAALVKYLDEAAVSRVRWVGVYQAPFNDQVGIVVADSHCTDNHLEMACLFRNETVGFVGAGRLAGQLSEGKFSMGGLIYDDMQESSFVSVQGVMRDDLMEGIFTQRATGGQASGVFVLVKVEGSLDSGGQMARSQTEEEETQRTPLIGTGEGSSGAGGLLIDLNSSSPGLLGPGRANAYGPGIHSDATGRPFMWRTEDGQSVIGGVKPNAYGPGVGMDQFGRPVRAKPLW